METWLLRAWIKLIRPSLALLATAYGTGPRLTSKPSLMVSESGLYLSRLVTGLVDLRATSVRHVSFDLTCAVLSSLLSLATSAMTWYSSYFGCAFWSVPTGLAALAVMRSAWDFLCLLSMPYHARYSLPASSALFNLASSRPRCFLAALVACCAALSLALRAS